MHLVAFAIFDFLTFALLLQLQCPVETNIIFLLVPTSGFVRIIVSYQPTYLGIVWDKDGLTQYPCFVRFSPFLYVFLFHKKYVFFFVRMFICPYLHKPDCDRLDKSFSKKFLREGVQPYFEILLSLFIHKIIEQIFYQYVSVYLVWIMDMHLEKRGRKSAYFFIEKQKCTKNSQKWRKTKYYV